MKNLKVLGFAVMVSILLLPYEKSNADDPNDLAKSADVETRVEKLDKNFILTGFINTAGSNPDNTVFINTTCINTTATLNGCNVSLLHPPYTAYGFNGSFFALAAGFGLPEGLWKIDSVHVYAYQIGSNLYSTITGLNIRITTGNRPGGGILFGDFTQNRMIRTEWACIYRNNDYVSVDRPVMRATGRVGTTIRGAQYWRFWLEFKLSGSMASDVWVPPVEESGFGYQYIHYSNFWRELRDGPSQEYYRTIPIAVFGSPGCELSAYPEMSISNSTINGDSAYLQCGGIFYLPNHNDVCEFDLNVTDADLSAGDSITLNHSIIPDTACYNVEVSPQLPIRSSQPISAHVRITRKPGSAFLCGGFLEFSAMDKCVNPNTSFCRTTIDRPLPAEIVSFTSSVIGNDVELTWTTSSESNNSGFEIERRRDSHSWLTAGHVQGNGNSSEPKTYYFRDTDLSSGSYAYRLRQIDFNGNFEYFNLSEAVTIGVPDKFFLGQNYPNPFNPVTTISFGIAEAGNVMLKLFDISGREVKTLISEPKEAGYYTVKFDAGGLASGAYFYRIESGSYVAVKKMVFLK